jgi:pyruvate,water dikinase
MLDGMRQDLTFTPPGPGSWELEIGHHGRRPLSGFLAETYRRGLETGSADLLARYGLPLARIRAELVHGCEYLRPIGVGEGDTPGRTPPVFVLKLLARLHPELRRRNRTAAEAWASKRWREDVDRWFGVEREQVVAANLGFQGVVVGALDDASLTAHVAELLVHFEQQVAANIANHGGDLIPVGDYLAHCAQWGIGFADASALLQGSSPASTATAELLAPVRAAVDAAEQTPTSVDAVRALGPEAAAGVDAWFERYGWRAVTTDDVDRPTLAERPAALLAALLAAAAADPRPAPPAASPVRDRVPVDQRARFDELLAEARYGLRQRDDVVGTRWNWPVGLLRRALLEVGRRLVDRARLLKPDHAVELASEEIESLLAGGTGPGAAEVAARADRRDEVEALPPPLVLGEPEDPPPVDALPAPMARATRALLTVLEADTTDESASSGAPTGTLQGTGIGITPYTGRARVATPTDDAIDRLEPGDVLIAPYTGPAYNSLLPIIGALVVEIGGSMCHAAIVAREFGLPAVIGAAGATQIPDGAQVEVDPARGVVRIVG